ncbi:hypothetical protein CDLVIII_3715 [Clostridium sp. DL-VIII]|uniref:hypothetical protein n=1 Tax=Clostridium sp. DL-VIII TaxID=641107 RepID=UPI00023AFE38|nr:hypothetical protein [Clostridium sp. DL-VIII]EHJ00271.1 hypothetical protein CDLVIII_3715 [Clostridium sp. DL-VIII]
MEEQEKSKEDKTEELEQLQVGAASSNSVFKKSDYGKEIGVLYKEGGDVKIHNGKIVGNDGPGYIVNHCIDANGTPFKFDTYYFYNVSYFYHNKFKTKYHHRPIINAKIMDSKNVFCYYGIKKGSKNYDTHNGSFVSFTYKDKNGNPVTSNKYSEFLSYKYSPSKVIEIVYGHFIMQINPKTHKLSLQPEIATATHVQHFTEILYKLYN